MIRLATGKASSSFRQPLFTGSSTSPSSYALAIYSGLWAFDGWDQANFVGGEINSPEKNIPRAIHSSMIIVTVRSFFYIYSNVSRSTVRHCHVVAVFTGQPVVLCGFGKGTLIVPFVDSVSYIAHRILWV